MTDKVEHPDPKKHQQISFLKSGVRILGYVLLLPVGGWVALAGLALIASEALGIYEELV